MPAGRQQAGKVKCDGRAEEEGVNASVFTSGVLVYLVGLDRGCRVEV